MALQLRRATLADRSSLQPRTRALQDHEAIVIDDDTLAAALDELLAAPLLGGVWLVERDDRVVGYALVTFGFDLEYGGRDAWLTELFIDDDARGQGTGEFVLAALEPELRGLGVRAVHLQVRPDNPALRLYERRGYERVPRLVMSKRL